MTPFDLNEVMRQEDLARQEERYAWIKGQCVGKVLEIGVGGAGFLRYLHSEKLPDGTFQYDPMTPVWGVDLMWEYIEEARSRFPNGNFTVMDMCRQPLPYGTHEFDTVVITEMLEHVLPIYIPRILAEAFRVCGGQIVITCPNIESEEWYAAGVLSANHFAILTKQIFEKLLNPTPKQLAWIRSTAWAPHYPDGFKHYSIDYTKSGNFITVKIWRPERFK